MSCDKNHLLETKSNFKLLYSINYEDTIPLYMYRSVNTGITVCIAEVEGPLIHGYFNIATETFDDDGLPFAVARLIFTGSQENPYYGILNFWAEKNLSKIHVVTFADRTCFTVSAAGSEGFLNILPVYLDYILYPSLEDSAYLTEIHNITSKGHAGAIYCYAQREERTSHYIIENKMLQNLYPGMCGHKSIIQGTTKNLRTSTNNTKVRKFHKKFYTPRNLTILITGKIEHDTIFHVLQPLEYKIMVKSKCGFQFHGNFTAPWKIPIERFYEQLMNSVNVNVYFPSTDETYGMVYVAWRGPSPVYEACQYRGCQVLLRYLEMTKFNPLKKYFGEKSNFSYEYRTYVWSDSVFNIIFTNVSVEQIQMITKESVLEALNDIYNDGINMETICTLIQQDIRYYQRILEKYPQSQIAPAVFNHILKEDNMTELYLKQNLNNIRDLERLKNELESHFVDLLKTCFIDKPMVVVRGNPSLHAYSKLQEKEKHTAQQIWYFNTKNTLREKEFLLRLAIKKQNILCTPSEVLASMPVSGIDSITFHHIERYSTETDVQHSKLNVKELPFFTYLDDVKTNFVYLQVVMDTSSISTENKNYIFLLMDVIKNSPVKRDDQLISYKVDTFDTINVIFENNINNMGNYKHHSMSLMIKVELKKYEKCVQLCKELLYNTELTAEQLKISTARLLDDNKQVKVQVRELLDDLMLMLLYKKDSIPFMCNKVRKRNFFTVVKNRLDTDARQNVIAEIEFVRKTLTSPKNMFVHMVVNVDKLTEQGSDVYAPWNKFFSDFSYSEKTKPNLIADWNLITFFENSTLNGCIMGLECIDSSFFTQTCRCINDVRHPDLPALIVCSKYFTQAGGHFHDEFREKAFSEDSGFQVSVNDGLLYINFYSATNLIFAYNKVKMIVDAYAVKVQWNQHLYEKAKSLAILECIDNVRSIRRMTKLSLKYSCNNVPYNYVYDVARRISDVTMKDLSHVITVYFKPLFDPKKCKTAIICNTYKSPEICRAFENMNFNFKVYKSLEELTLNLSDGICEEVTNE